MINEKYSFFYIAGEMSLLLFLRQEEGKFYVSR